MANGLIFVFLVKEVRQKVFPFKCSSCQRRPNDYMGEKASLLINSDTNDKMFTPTNSLT